MNENEDLDILHGNISPIDRPLQLPVNSGISVVTCSSSGSIPPFHGAWNSSDTGEGRNPSGQPNPHAISVTETASPWSSRMTPSATNNWKLLDVPITRPLLSIIATRIPEP